MQQPTFDVEFLFSDVDAGQLFHAWYRGGDRFANLAVRLEGFEING